jgi:hypothetical protein
MIKLFEEQKISLYKMQKDLNYGIYTLYRYARGQRRIENMPINMLFDISIYLGIEPGVLYEKMKEYEANRGV